MRNLVASLVAAMVILLCAAPALAAGMGISPPSVEFDVPGDGSATVDFYVFDFSGDIQISLEDIPLTVEPQIVHVTASGEGTPVQLAFYGDESLGSQVFDGKIKFLGMTGGTIATGIKIKATVNHVVVGQPLPEQGGSSDGFNMPLGGWIVLGIAVLFVVLFFAVWRVRRS